MKKPKKFSGPKEVRAIARERIGTVKAGRVIVPKSERSPKYKADPLKRRLTDRRLVGHAFFDLPTKIVV